METPEPGQADGEEQMVELRPRTRSNPEGAEDRRSSTGSLNNSLYYYYFHIQLFTVYRKYEICTI
uniref:Uncharacterized protein n=1 Tax=Sinocyclocheilus grahami TaxID=75366 RepID=A0A672LAC9_SINGR